MEKLAGKKILSIEDLAYLFDVQKKDLESCCADVYKEENFIYEIPSQFERNRILLEVFKRLDSDLPVAGKHRIDDWRDGWRENLEAFKADTSNMNSLIPYYFTKNTPMRYLRDFITPKSDLFVFNILDMLRRLIFSKYFEKCENIYEFGCGTGHNLACFAQMAPHKKYFGFDWAESSQQILFLLNKTFNWEITGGKFDLFSEKFSLSILPKSGVLTFSALEQAGDKFRPFVNLLLREKPMIVVNIEPLDELYDDCNLLDYLGGKYQKKRNYLTGFLTYLSELEDKGKIEILRVTHNQFGDTFFDGASYVVWRPL